MKAYQLAQRTIFASLLLFALFSCTKEPNLIGVDLVPPSELLTMGYSDTVQIEAFSVREDSVKTSNLSYAILGSMYDPLFGRTTADWFSQIRLSKEPTNFGTNAVFDSAFLYLPYSGSYGDTLSNMTLRVYALTDDLADSVQQYSNHTVDYDQNSLLGELTFTPRPSDSTFYEGAKQMPSLRIPLNSKFGELTLVNDTNILNTNTKFLKHFKGIAVIAEPQLTSGKGAIIYMSVTTGYSDVAMYYHNNTDTAFYSFTINANCQRFNHYEHYGYADAAPMLRQQIAGDSTIGRQFLFMQAMGGVKVKLKFPTLRSWSANRKVVINDAQLILANASNSGPFTPPTNLTLYPISNDGKLYPYQIVDYDEGSSYYDGYYNLATSTYRFRLSRYIQQLINGVSSATVNNNGLYMLVPTSSITASRLALNGTASPPSSLKLYLKYTLVK